MFLIRWSFRLFFLTVFAFLIFWGTTYKVNGKPLYKVAQGFFGSGSYKEGMKDLKIFVGGLLKTVGEQIQEDVTEDEKKQLDKMIQNQLKNSGYKEIKK